MSSRLLILSCSERKSEKLEPLPAVERYDGPTFRVLRRYLRESGDTLPVRIISAQFGLIGPHEYVGLYDRKMTDCRARELEPVVAASFKPFVQTTNFDDLMVVASGVYLASMAKCWPMLSDNVHVHAPSGSIGRRVAQLRDWLYGKPPVPEPVVMTGHIKFRGANIVATEGDVLALARRELSNDGVKAMRFESWCVPVDDRLVAPKWLVSKLSGVPVSGFRTADALYVLRKLGVEVRRLAPETHERNIAKEKL